jgi:hypothetical protein
LPAGCDLSGLSHAPRASLRRRPCPRG